eukprot:g66045.t1
MLDSDSKTDRRGCCHRSLPSQNNPLLRFFWVAVLALPVLLWLNFSLSSNPVEGVEYVDRELGPHSPVLASGSELQRDGLADMVKRLEPLLREWFGWGTYERWHMHRIAFSLLQAAPLLLPDPDTTQVLLIGEKGHLPLAFHKLLGLPWSRLSATSWDEHGEHLLSNNATKEQATVRLTKMDASGERWPFDSGSQQLVYCTEVLEHLPKDPMAALLEARRVLAIGGHLLLSTPNAASFPAIARALQGKQVQYFSQFEGQGGITHIREYSVEEVRLLCEAAGFETIVSSTFSAYYEEANLFRKHRKLFHALIQHDPSFLDRSGSITMYVGRRTSKQPTYRFLGNDRGGPYLSSERMPRDWTYPFGDKQDGPTGHNL